MAYYFKNALSNVARNANFRICEEGKESILALPDWGRPFDPEKNGRLVPNWVQQEDRLPLRDSLSISMRMMVVTRKVVDIIETFEPGVHEFLPLEIRDRAGHTFDVSYFIVNPQQAFCALMINGLRPRDVKWKFSNVYGPMPAMCRIKRFRMAPLSRPRIAGRHLWRSEVIEPGEIFLSNELGDAIRNGADVDWTLEPREELDREWVASEQVQPFLDRQAAFPANLRTNILSE
ncbi:MAG: hypothetical protein GJ676_06175 [Rhodobacteraceae bacterium]|nr:hypothetical protein [Paracoccaceae bacterium]